VGFCQLVQLRLFALDGSGTAAALLLKNGLISFFSRLLWQGSLRGLWRMVYRKSDEIVKVIYLIAL
jgi:hypothetical protein